MTGAVVVAGEATAALAAVAALLQLFSLFSPGDEARELLLLFERNVLLGLVGISSLAVELNHNNFFSIVCLCNFFAIKSCNGFTTCSEQKLQSHSKMCLLLKITV